MSNWMIPENKLSCEERAFTDEFFPNFKGIKTRFLLKLTWLTIKKQLNLADYQFHFNKLCKKSILLLESFDSQRIMSIVLHLINYLNRKHENILIAILVPNSLLISILRSVLTELRVPEKCIQISNYFHFIQNNNKKKFDYIFLIEGLELTFDMIKELSKMTNILILSSSYSVTNNINPYTKEPTISKKEIELIVNATWSFNTICKLQKNLVKIVSLLNPSMSSLSSKTDNTKKDVTPILGNASIKSKEVEYIISKSQDAIEVDENVAIVLTTQSDVIEFINIVCMIKNISIFESNQANNYLMQLNLYLENNNLDIVYIGNKNSDQFINNIEKGKIIVLSYKNIRFINFDNVFLPFFSEKLDIFEYSLKNAIASVELHLNITYSGKKHEFLERIEQECNKVDIDKILNQSNNSDDDFDF
ncbi:MAG: hypothetical protein U9N59_07630 [Campylobacterota bacterium]|nr:hypothetical protein [Campylobacterota bacterium]